MLSSRPVSSPTVNRCAASGGNTPALRIGAAIPSPRFTPCATPASAPAMLRLFSVAAAMPSDCTSGTEFATSVAMARANRDVSAFSSASPSSGNLQPRTGPTTAAPPPCRYTRESRSAAAISAAATIQPVRLAPIGWLRSMICVGIGIFMRRSIEDRREPRHHEIQQNDDRRQRPRNASSAG